jgi:hypothetical protein
MNAAVNWRDYGRSRWQLSEKSTPNSDALGRGNSGEIPQSCFAAREAGCGPPRKPPSAAVASANWGTAGINRCCARVAALKRVGCTTIRGPRAPRGALRGPRKSWRRPRHGHCRGGSIWIDSISAKRTQFEGAGVEAIDDIFVRRLGIVGGLDSGRVLAARETSAPSQPAPPKIAPPMAWDEAADA